MCQVGIAVDRIIASDSPHRSATPPEAVTVSRPPRVSLVRLSWRSLWARKLRVVLTCVAIAAGVSFFTGAMLVADGLNRSFTVALDTFSGGVDFHVRAKEAFDVPTAAGRRGVGPAVGHRVARVDGVDHVEPVLLRPVTLLDARGRPVRSALGPALLVTVGERPLNGASVLEGRAPKGLSELAVDQDTVDLLGIEVGVSTVRVVVNGASERFDVVGSLALDESVRRLGVRVVGADPAFAAAIAGTTRRYDSIAVVLADDADRDTTAAEIEKRLPRSAELVEATVVLDEQLGRLHRVLGPFSNALIGFALMALFVAGFIAANTFTISVGQRTRELAFLRCLGARRSQLAALAALEAFTVGALAVCAGLAAGEKVGQAIVAAFTLGAGFPPVDVSLTARTVVAAVGATAVVVAVSAARPTWRAARVSPLSAMTDVLPRSQRSRTAVVASTGAVVVAVAVWAPFGGIHRALLGVAGALTVAVFLPTAVSRSVLPAVSATLARRGATLSAMSVGNAARAPRRTGATAAALAVGVSLVASMTTVAAGVRSTLIDSVDTHVTATHLTTIPSNELGRVPGDYVDAARETGAFRSVVGMRRTLIEVNDTPTSATVVDAEGFTDVFDLTVLHGDPQRLSEAGGVAIESEVAAELDIEIGSIVPVRFQNGDFDSWEVVAVFSAPGALLEPWVVAKSTRYGDATPPLPSDRVVLATAWSSPAAASAQGSLNAQFPGIELVEREQYLQSQKSFLSKLLIVVNALLALAVGVALVGVANTMSLSVLEREKELRLLRSLGATRRQLRRLVVREAAVVGVLGGAVGVCLGAVLGAVITRGLPSALAGDVVVPKAALAALVVAAGFAALSAAWWPSWRASRMQLVPSE
jgi:putative ABC transport system permease protein